MVDNLAGADIVVGEEEPKHKPPPLAAPPQSVLAGDSLVSRCYVVCKAIPNLCENKLVHEIQENASSAVDLYF